MTQIKLSRRVFGMCCGWFAAALAFGLLPIPIAAQQTNENTMYFVQGEKYPRGLSDFQAFGLTRAIKNGKPRYSGWVMTDRSDPDNTTSDMKSVRVNGAHLSFTARTRAGLVLTFDGRFLRRGDFQPLIGKDVPVVEGVAHKLRRGRSVAAGRMRFVCGTGD